MKTIDHNLMRRVWFVLATGLVLGGMSAATARADMYRMSLNAGGGVPAQAVQNTPVTAGTNTTLSWYGMQGWYWAEISTNLVDYAKISGSDTAATAHAWSVTVNNGGNLSANFRMAQLNSYAGSGNCGSCHNDKYSQWQKTAHSTAIKEILNSNGSFLPFRNASCLPCHTVGYNQPTGFTDASTTPHLENVGCENCHGPSGWHMNSDHALIHPAVSIDPTICGSCHQGSHHPTYEEYVETKHATQNGDIRYGNAAYTNYFTNTVIIGSKVYYGYAVTNFTVIAGGTPKTNTIKYTGWTNIVITAPNSTNTIGVTNAVSGIVNSSYVPGSGVDPGQSRAAQCGVCHSAATRYAMLSEYNDYLAGRPHALDLALPSDASAWTVTCATCHDPHSTTNIAQLRYPTRSTNFYTMPTTTDASVGTLRSTNALGQFATNTVYQNTTFHSKYDPNIQVCGQCHNSRGATWDGTAYGLVTNSVVSSVTNISLSGDRTHYVTNVVSVTNLVAGVTNYYPFVTYTDPVTKLVNFATNADGSFCTNSSGYGRTPHHSPQYNILVGKPDANFYLPATIHSHGSSGNTNQCATCHAASYAVDANSNVTGHTFELSFKNCVQCHSGLTDEAFESKIEDIQYQETNAIIRVVGLLNQWATTPGLAPDILRTNYGSLAWEYTAPGELGNPTGNAALVGPPSAFSWKTNQVTPTSTNDNLQMMIPANIRKARFNIYMILRDGSLGVHNPTYTKTLLTNAEALVVGQFTAASYPASFSVFPVTYAALYTTYVGTNVTFTNITATAGGAWSFGDGTITNVSQRSVIYAYTNAGLYAVTYTDTASGSSMTRPAYIRVRDVPTISFTAGVTTGWAPLTVNLTNTSTSTGNVDWWRWSLGSDRFETTDLSVSDTFSVPGAYSVSLRANLSGGGNVSVTSNNYVKVIGLGFTNRTTTVGVAPLTVAYTNLSYGLSNYLWTFGDGGTSANLNPSYTYTNAGLYTVTLSGVYSGTTYSLARTNLVVAYPAPVAAFTGTITGGKAPLTVAFNNTSSNATSYAWSFGDGHTSTEVYPVNTYASAGTNTVTLKAINLGVTNTLTRTNYIIVTP